MRRIALIDLKFDSQGLLTAVVQDANTKQVLMLAMMNAEAVERTQETRQAHFWSRSRKCLWLKGETSGNRMDVQDIRIDCDGDAILLLVEPRGPACHTGETSCFYTEME
ncbi:MAG: phosphoribosyl-AMP cyclohydrolase [Chloroflexi bacterium]|nr:phosphoribosyl-AMP cyclohydrolase [Chloroflexota bacterium]